MILIWILRKSGWNFDGKVRPLWADPAWTDAACRGLTICRKLRKVPGILVEWQSHIRRSWIKSNAWAQTICRILFFRMLVARINAHLAQHDLLNHTGRQAGSTIQQALFCSSRIPDGFFRWNQNWKGLPLSKRLGRRNPTGLNPKKEADRPWLGYCLLLVLQFLQGSPLYWQKSEFKRSIPHWRQPCAPLWFWHFPGWWFFSSAPRGKLGRFHARLCSFWFYRRLLAVLFPRPAIGRCQ